MKKHTIYAENSLGFKSQFHKFLKENPEITIQSVYSPEDEKKKDGDQPEISGIALTLVYE